MYSPWIYRGSIGERTWSSSEPEPELEPELADMKYSIPLQLNHAGRGRAARYRPVQEAGHRHEIQNERGRAGGERPRCFVPHRCGNDSPVDASDPRTTPCKPPGIWGVDMLTPTDPRSRTLRALLAPPQIRVCPGQPPWMWGSVS